MEWQEAQTPERLARGVRCGLMKGPWYGCAHINNSHSSQDFIDSPCSLRVTEGLVSMAGSLDCFWFLFCFVFLDFVARHDPHGRKGVLQQCCFPWQEAGSEVASLFRGLLPPFTLLPSDT